jgi:uncharacterized OsmC-like protein
MPEADIRALQAPLKDQYRAAPGSALVTLHADASGEGDALACSVDIGRAVYEAQAHAGVGGAGTAACSGDLLLGALAACAQVTCQLIAAASGLPVQAVRVYVEGDLDLRGTLGLSREAPVGFSAIRVRFELDAPALSERDRAALERRTEQYCTVMQTLLRPPPIEVSWRR